MDFRARRSLFFILVLLVTCGIAGAFLGRKAGAQSANNESNLRDSLKQFTTVYSAVEQNYAEPLTKDRIDRAIYDGAIPDMLHVLDPHSNFYDPRAFAEMREEQSGKYFGVGMEIMQLEDKIVVKAPMAGTPAYKAGIRPGDVILAVNGKPLNGKGSDGKPAKPVALTFAREGTPQPMIFNLVRAEIPRNSVDL